MSVHRMTPVLVLGFGGLLGVAVLINYAVGDEPDHAYLSPAPDTIVWQEGDEATLWLETNRRDVELRTDSRFGFGDIKRRSMESGEVEVLGRSSAECPEVQPQTPATTTATLLAAHGLGLIACDDAQDVAVTLHGDEGEELNRYLVDVGPAPAATPTPPPSHAGYVTRRICVDATDDPANYFGAEGSGSEKVGDAFAAGDFGLSGTLDSVEIEASDGNEFFFEMDTLHQMTVSAAGASSVGLVADRVYRVALRGSAGDHSATLDVGVWVDKDTASPNDDGLCS